jgi:hypothetical protein
MNSKTKNDGCRLAGRSRSRLLMQAQKNATAIMRKLDSIRRQLGALPSFKGKAVLMDKTIWAWNRTLTLSMNIRDEQYNQQRKVT